MRNWRLYWGSYQKSREKAPNGALVLCYSGSSQLHVNPVMRVEEVEDVAVAIILNPERETLDTVGEFIFAEPVIDICDIEGTTAFFVSK